MSRRCEICGKGPVAGNSISRRGLAKKKGGIGLKTTGVTKRWFIPNLQKKRILIQGKIRKTLVCAKCIKSGKLTFPIKSPPPINPSTD
ncbi:MAG: 50S ribosomal protein L28 [Candidatus Omnitrophica bacterium]|nr:50S ribosomal protein L28 [Candidatus Omnitrophota bacterium]